MIFDLPLVSAAVNVLAESALGSLNRRHGVEGIPYLLSGTIHDQFTKAVEVATKALLGSIDRRIAGQPQYRIPFEDNTGMIDSIREVITSGEVAEEVSNLLDPGLEVFDQFKLTTILSSALPAQIPEETRADIALHAWTEFLRAFSFASRSLPELREFLRASYEAGSFRRISDIAGAIESFENNITGLAKEEQSLGNSASAYFEELRDYREWARSSN